MKKAKSNEVVTNSKGVLSLPAAAKRTPTRIRTTRARVHMGNTPKTTLSLKERQHLAKHPEKKAQIKLGSQDLEKWLKNQEATFLSTLQEKKNIRRKDSYLKSRKIRSEQRSHFRKQAHLRDMDDGYGIVEHTHKASLMKARAKPKVTIAGKMQSCDGRDMLVVKTTGTVKINGSKNWGAGTTMPTVPR